VFRALKRRIALVLLQASELIARAFGRRGSYGVLTVEIGGDLAEEGGEPRLFGLLRRSSSDYFTVVSLLRWAREDPRLRGVLIRCDHLGASWARLQGLRRGIERLRAAGKKVWVQLDGGGVREYYLASAAERVLLSPAATLDVTGLSSEVTFLLGALEKVDIQADVIQMGRYKSAGETFTRRDMSAEHREMLDSLLDDIYTQLVEAVSAARGLAPDAVRAAFDRGPFLASEAVECKLVDGIAYADEAEAQLAGSCGSPQVIESDAYSKRRGREVQQQVLRRSRGALALLHINGAIKSGQSIPGPEGANAVGAEALAEALDEARKRSDIRAVVLRVSSPGGSGLGSDLIWRAVQRTRESKPVIVSCGDVAASGGYYVAVATTPVLAEAGTITGSIGVVAGKVNLRGLYDRLGVTKEIVSRGKHAAMYSDYQPLGAEERERLHAEAESFYRIFVDKVAAGRGMTREAVSSCAEGRVWTGRQALQRGLIDELGGLEEAFETAKAKLGIPATEPIAVERLPRTRRLWKLSVDLNLPSQGRLADLLGVLPSLRFLLRERVWAVLPYEIRFF
jgi:protease IV